MITNLKISNFQSHRETDFELSSGITALLGPSDSGKSAILRALRWLVENKPVGDSFRSHWGGDTSISVVIDGKEIQRRRTKKDNQYLLEGLGEFNKIGAGSPPQEVRDFLDIDPVSLQWQHDAPFLLDDSPAEVARKLNRTVNLEVIDESMSRITSMQRSTSSELKMRKRDLEEAEERLIRFADLDELDGRVAGLEAQERLITSNKKQQEGLKKSVDLIIQTQSVLKRTAPLAGIDLSSIEEMADREAELSTKRDRLQRQLKEMKEIIGQLKEAEKWLKHEDEIGSMGDAWVELKRISSSQYHLSEIVGQINAIKSSLKINKDNLARLQEEWTRLMLDECPLCGRSCDCG